MTLRFRWMFPLCVAVLLVACKPQGDEQPAASSESPATPAADSSAAPGDPVDAVDQSDTLSLQLGTLDGATYDLTAHRGQWVVVNFWATWCGPCLKEMPELSALDAMRGHVEVIGLAYEEISPPAMRRFLEKHPVVYPIAIVDMNDPPADFDTPVGLPMTYLIAPDGTVAQQFLGPITATDIEIAIADAGGPQPGEAPPVPDVAEAKPQA